MKFTESDPGDITGSSAFTDYAASTTDIAPLKDWFCRPIQFAAIEWDEGTRIPFQQWSPWWEYFGHQNVLRKLEGYSRLRCDLKIKVIVNGSPFRFGEAMLSYRPLYSISTVTNKAIFPFFSGGQIAGDVTSAYPDQNFGATQDDKSTLMARSQRQNIKIQPHTSSGGEMTLPFIYYKDALELSDPTLTNSRMEQVFRELGTLTLESVTHLRSTAPANSDGVGLTFFVWAENVELWGPSSINVQAVDEYDEVTKPSGIASTVADAAGSLAKIPAISSYALATQMAAGKVANILRYFGWSNPPVLTPVQAKLPKASYLNPNPIGSFPDDVLALDPKNELTVDPRTVGVSARDELSISDLCSRPAIVDVIDWQVLMRNGSLIAEFPVHPVYFRSEMRTREAPKISSVRVTMIPACYVSQLFQYWRGTFVLKIRAVASQFHRGRLSVVWEPAANSSGMPRRQGANIQHVIDLATATEMTIKIPFMSHLGMLRVSDRPSTCNSQAEVDFYQWSSGNTSSINLFGWTQADLYDYINGVVQVRVLNGLQVGDTTADVPLVFEISFEDMVFMCPRIDGADVTSGDFTQVPTGMAALGLTDFTVQGMEAPGVSEDMQIVSVDDQFSQLSKLYGGEAVTSLRPLLHRTYPYKIKSRVLSVDTLKHAIYTLTVPRFPVPTHTKVDSYIDRIPYTSSTDNTNVQSTTPIAYITACFVGYRGSMVWKAHAAGKADNIVLTRSKLKFASNVISWSAFQTGANYGFDNVNQAVLGNGLNGVSWSSRYLANVASAVFPQYNNVRMMPGDVNTMYRKPSSATMPEVFENDGVRAIAFLSDLQDKRVSLYMSVAAGTDFNVFHFVNVPDIYIRQ